MSPISQLPTRKTLQHKGCLSLWKSHIMYFCAGAEGSGICRRLPEPFTDGWVMACPCTAVQESGQMERKSHLCRGPYACAELAADSHHPECWGCSAEWDKVLQSSPCTSSSPQASLISPVAFNINTQVNLRSNMFVCLGQQMEKVTMLFIRWL